MNDKPPVRGLTNSTSPIERAAIVEFQRFCDDVGKRAAQRGLTKNKLAVLLADDDKDGKED